MPSLRIFVFALLTAFVLPADAQTSTSPTADVHLRLAFPSQPHSATPAVVWLQPLQKSSSLAFPSHGPYTLLQKNRAFHPHLLVVPVGSTVMFPNADPFYHNVFSLFDGKRFDLGLYEAGSTRGVTFSREGVSYIFCNIHPEMSAVVIALFTPLYATATAGARFEIHDVPPGDYDLHVWVEGVPPALLDSLTRHVHVTDATADLGAIAISLVPARTAHVNKFGQPYTTTPKDPY
jgi:hypothetical protein